MLRTQVMPAITKFVQAIAIVMGIRPSIFGCPAGRSLGERKSKSRFSVLGISFPAVES
jgi:hypothetical protein